MLNVHSGHSDNIVVHSMYGEACRYVRSNSFRECKAARGYNLCPMSGELTTASWFHLCRNQCIPGNQTDNHPPKDLSDSPGMFLGEQGLRNMTLWCQPLVTSAMGMTEGAGWTGHPRTDRDDLESAKCISEPSLHPPSRQKTEVQAYNTGEVGQSWMLPMLKNYAIDRFLALAWNDTAEN